MWVELGVVSGEGRKRNYLSFSWDFIEWMNGSWRLAVFVFRGEWYREREKGERNRVKVSQVVNPESIYLVIEERGELYKKEKRERKTKHVGLAAGSFLLPRPFVL